jgi:hypothetical protein
MFEIGELDERDGRGEPDELGGIGELADRCQKAALVDVSLAANDELRQVVTELEGARSALDALEGHALAELEARDACDIDLGLSTVAWLTWVVRVPRRLAAVRVRVATKLRRELDGVDTALSEGRIGFEHARVLADAANPRVAAAIAEVQDHLVAAAGHAPFEVWRRQVQGLVELVDQDGGHDPDADRSRNRLHLDVVGDVTALRGELVGEAALVVGQALETATDQLWRRYRDDHEVCPELLVPPRSVLRALALAELVRHGLAETRPSPVVDVTLVVDGQSGAVRTPDGDPVDRRACGHLLCDPTLHSLWRDGASQPLDLKRSVRFATPHQRRVLGIRDGGCVFPGCGARASWCDVHHLVPWEHGGETNLDGLALLCRHHHGVSHRRGWTMTTDPAGAFRWTTPSGGVLHSRSPDPP